MHVSQLFMGYHLWKCTIQTPLNQSAACPDPRGSFQAQQGIFWSPSSCLLLGHWIPEPHPHPCWQCLTQFLKQFIRQRQWYQNPLKVKLKNKNNLKLNMDRQQATLSKTGAFRRTYTTVPRVFPDALLNVTEITFIIYKVAETQSQKNKTKTFSCFAQTFLQGLEPATC